MHFLEIAARWAWETSVVACVLVAPALFAAIVLRKATFTSLRYVLGLLVVARLLMPVAIPSPLSVFNLFKATAEPSLDSAKTAAITSTQTSPAIAFPQNQSLLTNNQFAGDRLRISMLSIIWACGVMTILARVFWQHRSIRKWIAKGEKIEGGPAIELLVSARQIMNCRRDVQIYLLEQSKTPALFGMFHPKILLPREFVANGDMARLRLVFLHEIAHLRRMDVLVNWLGIFARALHWFNPLVWLTLRRLRVDQELLCDRDVMRALHPEEHHTYGETLLALASPRAFEFSTLIPVSSNFKQLKERIAMIKQFNPKSNRLLMFALPPIAAAIAVVTFTAAAGKTSTKPPEIKSEVTAERRAITNNRIDGLEKQLDIANGRVREFEDSLEKLRRDLGFSAGTKEDLAKQFEARYRVEPERSHAELEYIQEKALFESLRGMDHQELIHTLPTAHPDTTLDALLLNLQNSERELAGLMVDKGPDHAEVKRVEAMVKLVKKQIDQRINGILSGMEKLVVAHKAVLDSLAEQAAEQKKRENDLLSRSSDFFLIKRNLEIEQQVRDALYVRLLQEKSERQVSQP